MQIAYTMAPGRGDTDQLLYSLAQSLMAEGLKPRGIVQVNTDRPDAGPCDMDVTVLPAGPDIRISQSLGRAARGCRLDPEALETAVALVDKSLDEADCLIINKFGKHEAEGRGFRNVIAEALAREIPVLVGLNTLNADAFFEFTQGIAQELTPDHDLLAQWIGAACAQRLEAA